MLLRYTQLGRLTRIADTSTKKPPTLRRSGRGEAALLVEATRGKARQQRRVASNSSTTPPIALQMRDRSDDCDCSARLCLGHISALSPVRRHLDQRSDL